jgi:pimeloyl-ACP methyl ester carboxylesterase
LTQRRQAELPAVEGVRHRTVDAGGIELHVAEAGPADGDPVLLVHGWPQHWYEWRHLVPRLSRRYRLVMPDLRGLGWSEVTERGYEKDNLARDLINLLDGLGIERVKLVGHDWGGYAGFLMCLFAPARVERYLALNIIHPWPSRSPAGLVHSWRLSYQLPLVAPFLGPRVTRGSYVKTVLRRGGGPGVFREDELEAFAAPLRDPERAKVTPRYYRAFHRHDLPRLMTGHWAGLRLQVPTLLLFGTGDFAIHRSQLRGYERHADDMRVEFVDGAGHFIADARPELVAERALDFFAAR